MMLILFILCLLGVKQQISGRKWKIDEMDLCFHGFCKILGMNPRTVLRMAHGTCDLRTLNPSGAAKPSLQKSICSHFFMELYICSAENLPEVEQPITQDADDQEAFQLSFRWCLETSVPERIALLVGQPDSNVPVRYLPPGKLIDLWYQFLSWIEAQRIDGAMLDSESAVPSWSTFYRCWQELWYKRCLRFREPSQHAECDDCFRFRNRLAKGNSASVRVELAAQWRSHLLKQWLDRAIYWSLRFASRSREANILTVIADSMDKSKWCYPKYHNYHRVPHELEGYQRPKLVLTAVLAHGFSTGVFVSDDETIAHGASMTIEVISRTLQMHFDRSEHFAPVHLCLQSDNTTAFTKNSDTHVFMAYLVARGLVSTGSVNYLTKGHTHEDVDGFLSELLPSLRKHPFNSADDVVDLLKKDLGKKKDA